MKLIPGLSLRASEEAEREGIDEAEIGELAYDFVEREQDYIRAPERKHLSSSSIDHIPVSTDVED
jgi:ammonium transporter, Amt family